MCLSLGRVPTPHSADLPEEYESGCKEMRKNTGLHFAGFFEGFCLHWEWVFCMFFDMCGGLVFNSCGVL